MKRVPGGSACLPALLLCTALAVSACGAQSTSGGGDSGSGGSAELVAVPGFDPDAKTITVGNIIALSGPISATAQEQLQGQQAWYDKVNAEGGVAGEYQIEMVTATTSTTPSCPCRHTSRSKATS